MTGLEEKVAVQLLRDEVLEHTSPGACQVKASARHTKSL